VKDKDRANFCSFFSFKMSGEIAGEPGDNSPRDNARQDFQNLFGDE
jgi:hypothetical protein